MYLFYTSNPKFSEVCDSEIDTWAEILKRGKLRGKIFKNK